MLSACGFRLLYRWTGTIPATATGLPRRLVTDDVARDAKRSKAAAFFDPDVQSHLQDVTDSGGSRIFRTRKKGVLAKFEAPMFVTDEELRELNQRAHRAAKLRLQMPPVMDERQPVNKVLDSDPAIKGYDNVKLVFTDITYGVHDRDRIMVIREPDGVLREAEWDERDRLNQLYFPKPGRKQEVPAMFQPENLQDILGPNKYEYILDRACTQFEPDHPIFIRTSQAVYEHVHANGNYDSLDATRHFGPLVFNLIWDQRADDIIVHFLQKRDIGKAVSVVRLHGKIFPESAAAHKDGSSEDQVDLIRHYIAKDSVKSVKVNASLEACLEAIERTNKEKHLLREAHGMDSNT